MVMLDEAKKEIQSGGGLKDFGVYVDGSGGYCIYEVAKETNVFDSLSKWRSHVDFDVRQVLTAQQLIDTRGGPSPSAAGEIAEQ